jgi:ADP-ribosyl-[dinitrogen reductase] hydrolase
VRLPWPRPADEGAVDRAVGCLLGQVIGDSLGSLVEFQGPEAIRRQYPAGVRELRDGGVWNTLAGQPTDDSELALARTLAESGGHDLEAVAADRAPGRGVGTPVLGLVRGLVRLLRQAA